jgi:hypothetical protein
VKAQAGISPKDLLLSSMRDCWHHAHALQMEALDCRVQAELLPEMPPDPDTGKLSARDLLLERARYLDIGAQGQLVRAAELAKDVAPYEHAKLANQDVRLIGDIKLTIKKYSGG